MKIHDVLAGCILGTAVGDALGLPYEGLSRRRAMCLFGSPGQHHFFLRRGMISDDTEHTCMVAQALIQSGSDPESFAQSLAWRFRWWLLGLPAGIGKATLKSILKLWIGYSHQKSGVFSAGNGPAMRAAILGAFFDDMKKIEEYSRISTQMTHTDPKAEYGALTIALAAYMSKNHIADGSQFLDVMKPLLGQSGEELFDLLKAAVRSVEQNQSTLNFAVELGLGSGVSGYVYHTVPIVVHAWLSHPSDYPSAVTAVIECGGDADTTAAIAGGIVGARVGKTGIPKEWLTNIFEWPRSVSWMEKLANQLGSCFISKKNERPIGVFPGLTLIRNLFFLVVVFLHVFRRVLPPY